MCGRFTIGVPQKIVSRFNTSNELPLFKPSWNIAPQQFVPTITRNSPNKIIMMNWGLVFSESAKFGTINLRGEGFSEKPFLKHFLLEKRCLIVADSFYEWGEVNLEGKPEKYPFNFFLEDRKLFGFAGVYNDLTNSKGVTDYTCAIITTTPNTLVKRVHNRMPVIIKEEDENEWLNPKNQDLEKLLKYLKPYPAEKMKERIVSKRVNSPGNNDEKLIEEYVFKKNIVK